MFEHKFIKVSPGADRHAKKTGLWILCDMVLMVLAYLALTGLAGGFEGAFLDASIHSAPLIMSALLILMVYTEICGSSRGIALTVGAMILTGMTLQTALARPEENTTAAARSGPCWRYGP